MRRGGRVHGHDRGAGRGSAPRAGRRACAATPWGGPGVEPRAARRRLRGRPCAGSDRDRGTVRRGGPVAAIGKRYYQGEIEKSALAHQRALEAEQRVVVGVNRFVEKGNGAARVKLLRVNEKVRAARIKRLEAAKKKRDAGRAKAALDRLAADAAGSANLMEPVIEAVRASVTLGEISHALRAVFGVFDTRRSE